MTALQKPLESHESVQTWFKGLREQSGIEPTDDPARLKLLGEFCEIAGLDPDEIVRACLLVKEGRETKISIKGRRSMAERIMEFQSLGSPQDSRDRAKRGNTIRSFLIHNGIQLQSGVQF
ncbi:MAG TPA: hypothetical protein VED84_01415 [Acidimicrobiales bacterium]|nr:hypothetical protein [Acidimicrobiales bacterium]HYB91759.1 hypothetical protein [Candidatus Binataceae bacterium]